MPPTRALEAGAVVVFCAAAVGFALPHAVPDTLVGLQINPWKQLHQLLSQWNPSIDLGQRTGFGIAYVPLVTSFAVLRDLGVSFHLSEGIWLTVLLSLSGWSMGWLYGIWWPRSTAGQRLTAAALYSLNPFVLLNLQGASALLLPYAAAPLIAGHTLQFLRGGRPRITLYLTLEVGVLAAGINPTVTFIALVPPAILALSEALRAWSRAVTLRAAVCLVLAGAASLWWVGPFLTSIRAGGTQTALLTDPISLGAQSSAPPEILRLTGLWALYSGFAGAYYYTVHHFLTARLVALVTLIAPLFAVLVIYSQWRRRRLILPLTALLAVSWPLAISIYPVAHPSPSGRTIGFLANHVSVFLAFRANYKWVGAIAFAYVLLAPQLLALQPSPHGRFRSGVGAWAARSAPRSAAVGLAALTFVYGFPFFTHEVYRPGYASGTVPDYWGAAARWIDAQPDPGRVFFTPGQGHAIFTWGQPVGDIAPFLFTRPTLTDSTVLGTSPTGRDLVQLLDRAPSTPTTPYMKILALLGVRYLVQRNDVDWQYYGSPSPAQMSSYLRSQQGITYLRSFGKLDVYQVDAPPTARLSWTDGIAGLVGDSLTAAASAYEPGTLASVSVSQPQVLDGTSSYVLRAPPATSPQFAINTAESSEPRLPRLCVLSPGLYSVSFFYVATSASPMAGGRVDVTDLADLGSKPIGLPGRLTTTVRPGSRTAVRAGDVFEGTTEVAVPPGGGPLVFRTADGRFLLLTVTVRPSRALGADLVALPAGGTSGSPPALVPPGARYLYQAQNADPFWKAQISGQRLRATDLLGNGYGEVWSTGGRVGPAVATFSSGLSSWTWVLLCAGLSAAALAAVAFLERRGRLR